MSAEDCIRDKTSTIFGRTAAREQYATMGKAFGQLPVPHLADGAVRAAVERLRPDQHINVGTAAWALILELDSEVCAFDLKGSPSE